ncbi:hypothetical protein HOD08_01805 [bacterium]|nr:hypothetical protein [bacterium]
MKKILILAITSAIATNINASLENLGEWLNDHAHTFNADHYGQQAVGKKLNKQGRPTHKVYPEKYCGKCRTCNENPVIKKFKEIEVGKKYFEVPGGFQEINKKKCSWRKVGGLSDYPVRLATGLPLAAAGAALDLGIDGIGPMGRWAERNPKLAASLRAVAEVLNDVQEITTSSEDNEQHGFSGEQDLKLARVYIMLTILKAITQGTWDAKRLKAGAPKKIGEKRKAAITTCNMIARLVQIAKQNKLGDGDATNIFYLHGIAEPLLSGIANALRAGKSWEQLTNAIFTLGRPFAAIYLS